MNKIKVVLQSIMVAPGGFLSGFGTALISGAEQSVQNYRGPSPAEHGPTISIAPFGTINTIIFNLIILIIHYVPRVFKMTCPAGGSSLLSQRQASVFLFSYLPGNGHIRSASQQAARQSAIIKQQSS